MICIFFLKLYNNIFIIKAMKFTKLFFILTFVLLISYTVSQACTSSQFSFNGVCASCHVTCRTCNSDSQTSCLSCVATRTLSTQKACICNSGYAQTSPISADCNQLSCSFRCLTCFNTVTTCGTCKTSDNRVLVMSSNTCPCLSKYFDNDAAACEPCHHSCGQCTNSTDSQCSSCHTHAFRTLDSNKCICNNGFFDNGTYICASCNYKCLTCSQNDTNCLTCGSNRGTAPGCLCNTKFYDDGSTTACISCHYSCATCVNGSSCSTCNSTKFRTSGSLSAFCICSNRYYDDNNGNELCLACDVRCATCIINNQCLTCSSSSNRLFNSVSKMCQCRVGFFQVSATQLNCGVCNSRCLTCSGTAATACLTCDPARNRVFSSGSCNCVIGFFQNSTLHCKACHSSCESCTNISACVTCKAATLQLINSTNLCSCNSTHYFNSAANRCEQCDYKCRQCVLTSATNCTSCPLNSFRTFTNGSCPCNVYYFDNGVSICVRCHYTCKTCSSTSGVCLTCTTAAKRTLQSSQCRCQNLFYDNGALEICQPCLYNCLTCTDAVSCLSCNITLFRELNVSASPQVCGCSLYYFENSNLTCSRCRYNCYTCNNLNTCLTCNVTHMFRTYNVSTQNCDCINRYYDNFVNQTCLPCMPQCLTCTNATRCLTCNSTLNRYLISTNFCPCLDKFYDVSGTCTACMIECKTCNSSATCTSCNLTAFRYISSGNRCLCNHGYFDDGTNELCPKCRYSCLTCVSSQSNCTTCDVNLRILNNSQCECPIKYFDNGVAVACLNCHYTCQKCLQFNTCSQCSTSKFRTFDSINQYCICSIGYYDDGMNNETCKACNYRCLTCTNITHCLSCQTTSFRDTPASMCPCVPGYYDNNVNVCVRCHYSCKTCTNGSQCHTCNTAIKFRQFGSNLLCKCINRYFDDGFNQLCLPCTYTCLTCQHHTTNCTSCNATANRVLQSNNCNCKNRFYNNLNNLVQECLACHYSCQSCSSGTACQTCSASHFRQIDSTTGLCKCMNRFWNNGSSQLCLNCDPSCLTCTDTSTCTSCNITRNRMLNSTTDIFSVSSPFCVCLYRYFSLSSSNDCSACHYSCQVCSGSNRNNCVSCNDTAHRLFNSSQCLCKIGYYDDQSFEFCQTCHVSCAKCTNGLNTSCTICSPLYYLLNTTTTCYSICPDFFFNYQINYTCQSCSANCISCLNASYCSTCVNGHLLYNQICYSACPLGTYTNSSISMCINCPKGCRSCTGNDRCLTCSDRFYLNSALGFCFSCSTNCKECTGPGQNQCASCMSPYILINNESCSALVCPSGQYVDPSTGCRKCSSLHTGSLTCTFYQALSCSINFYLLNKTCIFCNMVPGFIMSNNLCTQVCGDGKLYTLQCDDGNKINGDGCSSNCLIQQGWICSKNSSNTSVCSLINPLSMSVSRFQKVPGSNRLDLLLRINLPVLISKNYLTISITDLNASKYSYTLKQNPLNLTQISLSIQYTEILQSKVINMVYNRPARRLLQVQGRQLTALSFSSGFTINSFPPALYYQNSILNQFKSIKQYITGLSLCLLILCLIMIPKRMHLHILTCIYIPAQIYYTYGVVASNQTDWIKYGIQPLSYMALKGGVSFGKCCESQNSFFNISSQITQVSGVSILVLIIVWFLYLITNIFHKYCKRVSQKIIKFQYFLMTITLSLTFGLFYSTMNSLYYFKLVTQVDTFNMVLGVILSIGLLAIVIGTWLITYYKVFPLNKIGSKIYNLNKDIQDQEILSENSQKTDESNKLAEEKPQFQFFEFDYVELYNHRILKNNNQTNNIVFSKAKYFLPVLITKVYLAAIFASLLQSIPLEYFVFQSLIEVIYLIFIISARPFRSVFTNIRLIIISSLFLAANILTILYLNQSKSNNYILTYERVVLNIIMWLLISSVVLLAVQHLLAWKHQLVNLIEPCLKGLRLLGTNRRSKYDIEEAEKNQIKDSKILMSGTMRQNDDRDQVSSQAEELDAFYARMLKKANINNQYRKNRGLKH